MDKITKGKKDYIKQRVNEIIDDYLYDDEETFCKIMFWFERSDGQHQEKKLTAGKPSDIYLFDYLS